MDQVPRQYILISLSLVITFFFDAKCFPLLFAIVFKGAYWISSNSSFIQYCDRSIGLFSIAPPLVVALPTLR